MKEVKRLDRFSFINKWGTIYIQCQEGWMLSNSIDCDDMVEVLIDHPTFEESVEDFFDRMSIV